jgi:hypothetical protein
MDRVKGAWSHAACRTVGTRRARTGRDERTRDETRRDETRRDEPSCQFAVTCLAVSVGMQIASTYAEVADWVELLENSDTAFRYESSRTAQETLHHAARPLHLSPQSHRARSCACSTARQTRGIGRGNARASTSDLRHLTERVWTRVPARRTCVT